MNWKPLLLVVSALGAAGGLAGAVIAAEVAAGGPAGSSVGAGGGTPLENPPVRSAGCGKVTTVTAGKHSITSTGQERTYIIDIPTNYDMNKPYRLFYTSHWISGTSEQVRDGVTYVEIAGGTHGSMVAPSTARIMEFFAKTEKEGSQP